MNILRNSLIISLLIIIANSLYSLTQEDKKLCQDPVDLFNVKFLRDGKKVRAKLAECGFEEVTFTTLDNVTIAGLFLDNQKQHNITIKGTLLFCAGWHPGLKEGMASFYELLKNEPYNFLFFDHRGHGQSTGQSYLSISGIQNYGQNEYKDIVAALTCIDDYNKNHHLTENIAIFGLCSGSYHTIRALEFLYEEKSPLFHEVKKVIIDSGWGCLPSIGFSTINGELDYRLTSYGSSLVKYPLKFILNSAYYFLFYGYHKQLPSLTPFMDHLDQEVLFIHAKNDCHVPLQNIDEMIAHCKHCQTWFIECSTHACNHLKNKDAYKKTVHDFLDTI